MSHDEESHAAQGIAKIVRMANQIGTFFESKPHEEGVHGVAEHINKFWEPRMRRHFFEVVDSGGAGLKPIVMEAAAQVRRPTAHVTAEQAAEAGAVASG
ncbi:formate dehydrogenase subunit delta [Mesorhizobium sp. KR9-304]|uniref:formate dehydrogenase subunit delta n=1 Tax=Mesorhizobium sp. KR9-304 TaxID=3156614 RepID=UPI0032B3149F